MVARDRWWGPPDAQPNAHRSAVLRRCATAPGLIQTGRRCLVPREHPGEFQLADPTLPSQAQAQPINAEISASIQRHTFGLDSILMPPTKRESHSAAVTATSPPANPMAFESSAVPHHANQPSHLASRRTSRSFDKCCRFVDAVLLTSGPGDIRIGGTRSSRLGFAGSLSARVHAGSE